MRGYAGIEVAENLSYDSTSPFPPCSITALILLGFRRSFLWKFMWASCLQWCLRHSTIQPGKPDSWLFSRICLILAQYLQHHSENINNFQTDLPAFIFASINYSLTHQPVSNAFKLDIRLCDSHTQNTAKFIAHSK